MAVKYPIEHHFPTVGETSPMTKGPVVKEIQELLHYNRFGVFYNEKIDGQYGPHTAQAVHHAKYMLGYPKHGPRRVDRHFGRLIRAFLLPESHPQHKPLPLRYRLRRKLRLAAAKRRRRRPLGQKALAYAQTQIGIKESPAYSNIVKYSIWYGMTGPWCAMFVSYCYHKAGSKWPIPRVRWASVFAMCSDARLGRNGLRVTNDPQPGDPVGYHFDEPYQHCGLFEKWVTKGYSFLATEGNTGPASIDNGGEVVAHNLRYVANVHCFMRMEG